MRKPPTGYVTKRNAAEMLGVSLRTVCNWIDAGRLKKHRYWLHHVAINKQEVEDLKAKLNTIDAAQ